MKVKQTPISQAVFIALFGASSVAMAQQAATPEGTWALLRRWIGPEDAELWRQASYRFHALVADRWRVGRVLLGDLHILQAPDGIVADAGTRGGGAAQQSAIRIELEDAHRHQVTARGGTAHADRVVAFPLGRAAMVLQPGAALAGGKMSSVSPVPSP